MGYSFFGKRTELETENLGKHVNGLNSSNRK